MFKTKNNTQLFLVFLVFSITGSLSVLVSKPIIDLLKYSEYINNEFLIVFLRVLIIFPLYQFILILVGAIFGQFDYFWSFQKKFFKKLIIKKS